MLFFDTFDTLSLSKELQDTFVNTDVIKFTIHKNQKRVQIKIAPDKFILPTVIYRLQKLIERQMFENSGFTAEIITIYPFMQDMSCEEIWDKYGEYIRNDISETSRIFFQIINTAQISFENDVMHIALSENGVFRGKEREVTACIKNIFMQRFSKDVGVKFTYNPVSEEEYTEKEDIPVNSRDYVNGNDKVAGNVQDKAGINNNAGTAEQPKTQSKEKTEKKGSSVFQKRSDKGNSAYSKAKDFKKRKAADPDIIYGRNVDGDVSRIVDIVETGLVCVVQGEVISIEERNTANGKFVFNIAITDYTDSIAMVLFMEPEERDDFVEKIKVGQAIKVKGVYDRDDYQKCTTIKPVYGIKPIDSIKKFRMDNAPVKRIELHAHTKMSEMDGVVDAKELVKTAFKWGHSAVAITDHGVVYAFPEASHAIDIGKLKDEAEIERAKNFKVIYGVEAYVVDDEPDVVKDAKGHVYEKGSDGTYSAESIRKMPSYHTIILCRNNTGRINLYKMISLSHIDYFGRVPRIPKSLLNENREGLLVGSACEAGELYRALLNDAPPEEIERIAGFYDYYEIQPLGNNRFMLESEKIPQVTSEEDLINLNKRIIDLGRQDGKIVVATCDVHFLNPEDEIYRRIIMSMKGFDDADKQAPLYLRTTEEMLNEFSYLDEKTAYEVVVEGPARISDMIEKISPVRPDKCPPVIPDSDKTLREICYNTAHSIYGENLPPAVEGRLEHELDSIIRNGFAVMYIIAQRLVSKSNADGYLVGSRGSVGSSFVATMAGITEINPLTAHYYCEKCHYYDFDSEEVKKYESSSGFDMPEKACPVCGTMLRRDGQNIPFETFLGFKGDKEPDIDLNFSGEYQSKAHDYTEELFGKGNTFRAGTISGVAEKTAFGYVSKYFEEHGIVKRNVEIVRIAKGCEGVRKTTGQHPGGIVVMPHGENIYSFTPIQRPANDMNTKTVTTHFDYHSIDHNLLKLDILGHDDPTMIRMLEDITGVDAKRIPMDDKKVLSLLQSTEALGIKPSDIDGCKLGSLGLPELGTDFVMNMLLETQPKNYSDTIRISGLSHGTDVWTNNTQELIKDKKCTLSTAICTRDDIMIYLIHMGVESSLSFKIMESVRKGKGLTPDMEAAMREQNVPDWYIWSCKKIKYMFPKAHAAAYVMMAFRIAYFKVYYPLAYYAAFFSIRATAFSYEKMCLGRDVLDKTIAGIKSKSAIEKLSAKEQDLMKDMKIVQEMYARGFEFNKLDIYTADAKKFKIVDNKLMPSLLSIEGLGETAAEQLAEAAKNGRFLSIEDLRTRAKLNSTIADKMNELGLFGDIPETNQLSLMDFI